MDQSDWLGLLRDLMKVGGGYLVAHGAVSAGNAELAMGLVLVVFPIVWSAFHRQQVKAAIIDSAVQGIVVSPTVAAPLAPVSAKEDIAVVTSAAPSRAS